MRYCPPREFASSCAAFASAFPRFENILIAWVSWLPLPFWHPSPVHFEYTFNAITTTTLTNPSLLDIMGLYVTVMLAQANQLSGLRTGWNRRSTAVCPDGQQANLAFRPKFCPDRQPGSIGIIRGPLTDWLKPVRVNQLIRNNSGTRALNVFAP